MDVIRGRVERDEGAHQSRLQGDMIPIEDMMKNIFGQEREDLCLFPNVVHFHIPRYEREGWQVGILTTTHWSQGDQIKRGTKNRRSGNEKKSTVRRRRFPRERCSK
jgi:hypothetical protein